MKENATETGADLLHLRTDYLSAVYEGRTAVTDLNRTYTIVGFVSPKIARVIFHLNRSEAPGYRSFKKILEDEFLSEGTSEGRLNTVQDEVPEDEDTGLFGRLNSPPFWEVESMMPQPSKS